MADCSSSTTPPLPPEGNHPGIDIGAADGGDYARIAQHVPVEDGRLDWRAVTFTTDGESSSIPG
jgi:hypothetical protein